MTYDYDNDCFSQGLKLQTTRKAVMVMVKKSRKPEFAPLHHS